ncbi:MAG: bifunctional 4-hydroxy-2-oxoglutarate aldolase/2-dehydro-3-deoxy-phosphogluconate aldolase [Blastocatellales bacterium]
MNRELTIGTIEEGRIIAILRGDFDGREEEIVSALVDGGITAVEVTLNSPDALKTIDRLARSFGSRIAVGAGTVLTVGEVVRAAGAGARFIVSPNRDTRVIAETRRLNLVSLPGCFTPSEIVEALDAGADAVKIFPVDTLGPAYIKAVRAPLGAVRMVPTGGVTPEKAREYFDAGAWAVGVGSELLRREFWSGPDLEPLRQRAVEYRER